MKEQIFNNKWSIVVILAAIALTAFLIFQNAQTVVGSVDFDGSGYQSTSTRETTGTILTNLTVLKKGWGTFGSVVITGANTGIITVYDATTTNRNLRTKAATTTLASIPASMAAGTYTFDVTFNQGLIFEYSGLAPTSTVTWK